MRRTGHFAAFDFDCEDMDPGPTPPQPPRRTAHRRIRDESLVGAPEGDASEERRQLVECPFRDEWPSLDACLGCEFFKGFSLDPEGKDSFVSCSRPGEEVSCPFPAGASPRSRALRTSVLEVMSDPVCVREDMTTVELARLFRDRRLGGAPVVDAAGRPLGIVSQTDLVADEASRADAKAPLATLTSRTARELMTPLVFSLPDSASIAEAADLMARRRIHRVPITSRSGRVVGMLTSLDLARWLATPENGRSAQGPVSSAAL